MNRTHASEVMRAVTEKPSPARVYDYLLGGAHNFPADQEAAEGLLATFPDIGRNARINRYFLGRAVRFLLEQGIDQFLDIGSGLPTVGSVHQIAQGANPGARVVYVDHDAVAVHHSREILRGNHRAAAVQLDVRDTQKIIDHPDVRGLLDFDRPVAVLLVALLHFIPENDIASAAVETLKGAICPGSYIAVSHATSDGIRAGDANRTIDLYRRSTAPFQTRTRDEVRALLGGLDLVEPGVVYAPLWRPESPPSGDPALSANWVGVGRKT